MVIFRLSIVFIISLFISLSVSADEWLPYDNGLSFTSYHTSPHYRASESHPLRFVGYALHPVGWIAREGVTRPLSYLMSSTEFTRSFFGYRIPGDYRKPECFSPDPSVPDCRSILPYNYEVPSEGAAPVPQVFFPNINFDFDVRSLNEMGLAKVREVADILSEEGTLHVVLEGHTDYIGSDEYNNALGMDRAEAVRSELVTLGVSPERLSTVTFGKTKPLIDEPTDAARAANRRVEVHPDAEEEVVEE